MTLSKYKNWLEKLHSLRTKIAKNTRENLDNQEKKEMQELGIDRYITYEFLPRRQICNAMVTLEMAGYWLLKDLEKEQKPKPLDKSALKE